MKKYRHRLSSMKMKSISIGPEFCSALKDVPVKDILASVDELRGISPSEPDLIRSKVVSTILKTKKISFDEKTNIWHCNS